MNKQTQVYPGTEEYDEIHERKYVLCTVAKCIWLNTCLHLWVLRMLHVRMYQGSKIGRNGHSTIPDTREVWSRIHVWLQNTCLVGLIFENAHTCNIYVETNMFNPRLKIAFIAISCNGNLAGLHSVGSLRQWPVHITIISWVKFNKTLWLICFALTPASKVPKPWTATCKNLVGAPNLFFSIFCTSPEPSWTKKPQSFGKRNRFFFLRALNRHEEKKWFFF